MYVYQSFHFTTIFSNVVLGHQRTRDRTKWGVRPMNGPSGLCKSCKKWKKKIEKLYKTMNEGIKFSYTYITTEN